MCTILSSDGNALFRGKMLKVTNKLFQVCFTFMLWFRYHFRVIETSLNCQTLHSPFHWHYFIPAMGTVRVKIPVLIPTKLTADYRMLSSCSPASCSPWWRSAPWPLTPLWPSTASSPVRIWTSKQAKLVAGGAFPSMISKLDAKEGSLVSIL